MPEAAPASVQREMPLATVRGEAVAALPEDLYIPPDALEVLLDAFSGPLDFLLYLIRRQNLDILELAVEKVAEQYLQYISLMEELRLEIAAEYLVMAATLTEIKSRMMLPQTEDEDEEEEDPRARLVRMLLEYEPIKAAAQRLGELPRMERDAFGFRLRTDHLSLPRPQPKVSVPDLVLALQNMAKRVEFNASHYIEIEPMSVQDRMGEVLERLARARDCQFAQLLRAVEGRAGVAVTLLAVLELLKADLIDCRQEHCGAPIHLWRTSGGDAEFAHA